MIWLSFVRHFWARPMVSFWVSRNGYGSNATRKSSLNGSRRPTMIASGNGAAQKEPIRLAPCADLPKPSTLGSLGRMV